MAVIRGRVAVIGGRGGRQRPGWPSVRPGWPSGQPGWPSVARVAVSNSPGGCLQQPVWPSAAAWVAACSSRCGRQQQPGWLSAAACVAICWAMVAISSSRGGHLQQPGWLSAAASKSIFQESRRHGGDLIRLVNQTNVAGITHYQSGGATWHANVPNLICRSRHLPDNYS